MRVQLWSYNYSPEPTGIAPVSTILAERLHDLGHEISVVAAHPHYPAPEWGKRLRPYRERRCDVPVLRLPLWVGRGSAAERIRQELSFAVAQSLALPFLGRPDVLVSASPSFPALLPAVVNARLRGVPWVLWLHDILPDGAVATGMIESGPVLNTARSLERAAYKKAERIVVLSASFIENLVEKEVPREKIDLIYNPATRSFPERLHASDRFSRPRILSMGNIGRSQGLAPLVSAFSHSTELEQRGAKLVIAGTGVAEEEVREHARPGRVKMLGLVDDQELEGELRSAAIALVTQQHEGSEFNLPSKLMNFLAYGLPVIAAVNPRSEAARLVEESGCGWVVDSSEPRRFPVALTAALVDPEEAMRRGESGRRYAVANFSQEGFAERFETVLKRVAKG